MVIFGEIFEISEDIFGKFLEIFGEIFEDFWILLDALIRALRVGMAVRVVRVVRAIRLVRAVRVDPASKEGWAPKILKSFVIFLGF